jgi:hypothetical protein
LANTCQPTHDFRTSRRLFLHPLPPLSRNEFPTLIKGCFWQSALPSALIAAQLLQSCWPIRPLSLGSWLDFLACVFRFLGNADTCEPGTPPPLPSSYGSGGLTEISPLPLPTLTRLLWLTSVLVSIGCVVGSSSLKESARRELREARLWQCPRWRRGEYADSGETVLLVDVTRTFHTIYACQLTSFLLFLWGLAIPLLRDPPSLLAIVGSGSTFFLGQCLIVSTLPQGRVELTVHPRGEKAVSLPEFLEN